MLTNFRPRLSLPSSRSIEAYSEAELISQFERTKRPIVDVSFLGRTKQYSFAQGLRIGNTTITEGALSPLTIKSKVAPQLSFFFTLSGEALLTEGTQATPFSCKYITFCSFRNPISFESRGFHGGTFQVDADSVIDLLSKNSGSSDLDAVIPNSATSFASRTGTTAYHNQLLSLLDLVSSCGGDADFLSRIGFDDVTTRVLCELLVAMSGNIHHQDDTRLLRRSDRSVDVICDFIASNIGTPLTITKWRGSPA